MDKIQDIFAVDKFKNKKQLLTKTLIVFALLFIPTITYLVILSINPSLKHYFDNISVVKDNFGKNVISNEFVMYFFAWGSFSFLVVGTIMTSFLILVLKSKTKDLYKLSYIILIAFFAVSSIVLSAISEHSYTKFYNLFEFLAQGKVSSNIKEISDMSNFFSEMYGDKKYKWSSDTLLWWLTILKIIVVILCFNIWLKNNNQKSLLSNDVVSRNLNQSKVKDFLNKFSLTSRKNILFWLIIGTSLVFVAPLVYIINMSLHGTQMNTMLNWTFIVSDLYKPMSGESIATVSNSSYFAIKILPIIVSGFLIANILISSVAYIQNWKSSRRTFAIEFYILLLEIMLVLIVIAYSAHEAQRITNLWNTNAIGINNEALSNTYLQSVYGNFKAGNTIPEPWVSGLKYISQTVISLSFLATIYTILGVKFKKINENK
ncbi:hypothetical protein [Spiroplasma sp. BIUS-1]|uniref:hypothetical protein n=1 Tax=Spiroplasma sp. BIUS-1 TaxID=216964 RepID=UPI0013991D6D|nr:hypothetical protein [Spiroplasma sp. BIUS-1]QHX37045.1 hypothetical protein SBIUS_v1c07920 [Spiroplasma sp. BIUS-1]